VTFFRPLRYCPPPSPLTSSVVSFWQPLVPCPL
jgi:hypothetical protein